MVGNLITRRIQNSIRKTKKEFGQVGMRTDYMHVCSFHKIILGFLYLLCNLILIFH